MSLLKNFSRITTPGREFIPQIDGLRFVAIGSVVAYHIWLIGSFHLGYSPSTPSTDLVGRVFAAGHFGVTLFFMVSGFIVSPPFARHRLADGKEVRLRGYFMRRLTRIEPVYVIHLAILFLLCALVYRQMPIHQAEYGRAGWLPYAISHLGVSLFYANGFVFGHHPYPNMVLWSLEVEVQFYLLAPWLAKIFAVRNFWLRRMSMVVAILAAPWLAVPFGGSYLGWASLAGNLQFFLAGFLLADFFVTGRLRPNFFSPLWDLIFVAAVFSVYLIKYQMMPNLLLPWLLLAGGLAAFLGTATPVILGNAWIATVGGMCYTIYLYHALVISLVYRATAGLHTHNLWLDLLLQFIVTAPCVLLISAGLFLLFERPFMRADWPARFTATVFRKHRPVS